MNQSFGYQRDSRSRFDKFWDEWGIVTQIGVGLLLTLVAPELGIPLLTIRNMAMVDSAFNVVVAAYETSRGDYDKAAGSVLFAILPHLKILKCPSSISKSISEKMAGQDIASLQAAATTSRTFGEIQGAMLIDAGNLAAQGHYADAASSMMAFGSNLASGAPTLKSSTTATK